MSTPSEPAAARGHGAGGHGHSSHGPTWVEGMPGWGLYMNRARQRINDLEQLLLRELDHQEGQHDSGWDNEYLSTDSALQPESTKT